MNEKVYRIFISSVPLTSYFDVALKKRKTGQGYVYCARLFSCNDSMIWAIREWKIIIYDSHIQRH